MKAVALLPTDGACNLAKVCGMLGSEHAGERAAAALKADQMVRGAGFTWRQIIMPKALPATDAKIRFCLQHAEWCCSDWDYEFLHSLAGRHRDELSENQEAILDRIYARAERYARTTR
jgi:hypothetical protein